MPIEIDALCQYYVLCTNAVSGVVRHPVLGWVPTCERCAKRHGLILEQSVTPGDSSETVYVAYDPDGQL